MKKALFAIAIFVALMSESSNQSLAHSGRTDSSGGHNCRTGSCAGTYHYHNGGSAYTPPVAAPVVAPVVAPSVPTPIPSPIPVVIVSPSPKPTPSPTPPVPVPVVIVSPSPEPEVLGDSDQRESNSAVATVATFAGLGGAGVYFISKIRK